MLFSSLTLANFDRNKLKEKLTSEFKFNALGFLETKIVNLKNLKTKDLIPALRSLVSYEGALKSASKNNQLEIRDYPAYINDIIILIKELDS